MIKVIALIGEAGSGKDRIVSEVIDSCSNDWHSIVSCTTRPPRDGEIDGINYYFLDEEQFRRNIFEEKMLEYTQFNNWYYGISKEGLEPNKINIGVFNPSGIYTLLKNPDISLSVYKINCNPKIRLLRQLNREENPNVDEIIRRYITDKEDFSNLDFKYINLSNNNETELLLNNAIIQYNAELDDTN